MKSLFGLFVIVCFIAVAHSFPGGLRDLNEAANEKNKKSNADTILILPGLQRNPFHRDSFQPNFHFSDITDDDVDGDDDDESFGFHPFRINFNPTGLFKSMQDAMKNLEAQLANSFAHIPRPGALVPWANVPEGANSTSTTKVIDGHVVTINETTYKSDDDNTYVRFRIVDVQPDNMTGVTPDSDGKDIDQNSGGEVTDKTTNDNSPSTTSNGSTTTSSVTTESTKEETTPSRSVETVEDLGNNEIPNSQVDNFKA